MRRERQNTQGLCDPGDLSGMRLIVWIVYAAAILVLFSAAAHAASTSIVLPPGDSVTVTSAPAGTVPPVVIPPVVTPPTPPTTGTCPGAAKTLWIRLDWVADANRRVLTSSYGGFDPLDVVVVQFTTGNVSTTNNLPHIDAVEYQGTASSRTATLSATPCDFSRQTAPGANINGNTVGAIFAIGTGTGYGYYPVLQTNTTYYLNIKNDPGAGCSWNNACNMGIALFKPGGL